MKVCVRLLTLLLFATSAIGQTNPMNFPQTILECQVSGKSWNEQFNSTVTVTITDAKYETRINLQGNRDFSSYWDNVKATNDKYLASYKTNTVVDELGKKRNVENTGNLEINRLTGMFEIRQVSVYPDAIYSTIGNGKCQKVTSKKF